MRHKDCEECLRRMRHEEKVLVIIASAVSASIAALGTFLVALR